MSDDKLTSSKSLPSPAKGGGSGDGSGPTGSCRSYPKGGKVGLSTNWNPQKIAPTDWAVGGV